MKVKELIDLLSEYDSDLEIEFEEYCADGGTWLLRFDTLMKLVYDKKETLLFNLKKRN